jgi:hypothetical protein
MTAVERWAHTAQMGSCSTHRCAQAPRTERGLRRQRARTRSPGHQRVTLGHVRTIHAITMPTQQTEGAPAARVGSSREEDNETFSRSERAQNDREQNVVASWWW